MVAWFGCALWQNAAAVATRQQADFRSANAQSIAATQDATVEHVEVATDIRIAPQAPRPPWISRYSLDAVVWALAVTMHLYWLTFTLIGGAVLIALLALRRRGLPFLVPLLLPSALILGTIPFARYLPDYRSNAWALERLQLVSAVLAAGVLAAVHWQLRNAARDAR